MRTIFLLVTNEEQKLGILSPAADAGELDRRVTDRHVDKNGVIKGVIGSLSVHAGDSDYAVRFNETAVDELLGKFEIMFSPPPSELSVIPVPLL